MFKGGVKLSSFIPLLYFPFYFLFNSYEQSELTSILTPHSSITRT